MHGNASQIIFNDFGLNHLEEENYLKFVLAGFLNLNITAAMLTSAIDLMSFFCSRVECFYIRRYASLAWIIPLPAQMNDSKSVCTVVRCSF